jgi:hypothetical protein
MKLLILSPTETRGGRGFSPQILQNFNKAGLKPRPAEVVPPAL